MTLSSRSAERAAPHRSWLVRLRPWRGGAPGPGPAPRADHGLWTVDRVMRALATACDDEKREVPAIQAVVVGADTVRLHLGTPDERPPADWTCEHDGRLWHAPLRRLQSARMSDALPESCPQLVSLGGSREGFVLLNLAGAGGIIGLEGDTRQTRSLVQDWTRELTTSPWSRDVRVVRIGFRNGTEPGDTIEAKSLGDAATILSGIDGAVLVLAAPPNGRDREFLHGLAEHPGGRWTVVILGRVEQPRWRLVLDAEGVVDTGFLAGPVARRLDHPLAAPGFEDPGPDPDPDPGPVSAAAIAPPGRGGFNRGAAIGIAVAAAAVVAAVAVVLTTTHGGSSAGTPVAGASVGPRPTATAPASPPPTGQAAVPAGSAQASAPATASAPVAAAGSGASLKNPATGECLSAGPDTDGTPLVLAGCDGAPNQAWQVAANGTIQSQGLCMDAAWGATAPGTVVQVARCSGNPAQQFSVRDGTVYSKQAELCLGQVNGGAAIHLSPCTGPASAFKQL